LFPEGVAPFFWLSPSCLTLPIKEARDWREDQCPHHNHQHLQDMKITEVGGVDRVKVVYDTSSGTTTKAVRGGSLLEGLSHYTLELNEHEMNIRVYVVQTGGM
jgi:hypothetical protein